MTKTLKEIRCCIHEDADDDAFAKMHPFEKAGLGKAPFKYVGTAEIPSPSMAQHNPEAYMRAMRELPPGFHCGSCAYCGQGIMINCLIQSADGQKFAVGSDCVRKVSTGPLAKAVDRDAAARGKAKRDAKKQEKMAERQRQWEAGAGERLRKQQEELAKREASKGEAMKTVHAEWGHVLPALDAKSHTSEFCRSLAAGIRDGQAPRGRAVDIVNDIHAKWSKGK